MKTVVASACRSGAENGIGGDGWGAPDTGFGITWVRHCPVTRSFMTTAGSPMAAPSVEAHLDALDGHVAPAPVDRDARVRAEFELLALDRDVALGVDLDV